MAEGKVVIQIIGRDKTGIATSKASRNFKNLSKSIRQSGLAQIATIGAASLAISKGISTLASFDTKIREISTLLDDVSEESIQDMGQEIETLAIDFGQSIDVMAKARYDAISAGFTNIADSAELLAVASKLAVGGVASVARQRSGAWPWFVWSLSRWR